jgi:hypothetical protein
MTAASCSSHPSAKTQGGGEGTTVPATTARITDPCELVTLTQAQTLIGGAELLPSLGVRTDDPDDRSCTYTAPENAPVTQVEVLFGRRAQAALTTERAGRRLVAVPLVGNEAHEENGAIFFRKKTTWVAIRVTGAAASRALRPRLEALARTITPKI